ncbi:MULTISPECIES: helix-turn-helix domain-containing protein [Bacteroides]|uniref:helix-turn-helix domain-containing protein n=1 Tax=Bacteroides TaxID=816 RepID=UPI000E450A0F|nr:MULTISPECIES: AraC family transcriptional regulator [Bacteroides]MBS7574725.1 helix-turn-helix transcriptional regulator [Bacteroides propionicigenes]RGM29087.1 AraC family transcriptional regulator [Bacteroides sp. OM08-17BH]RHJ55166.1 AraC family transcriptional regulator [Bacteroides sp. AM10-21B]HBO05399.1 AraC family transcriptional regulator [Bacteroides sp.]
MPDTTFNSDNTLHIKNMVCNRCIMVVKSQLEQLGLHPLSVELGIVTLPDKITDEIYRSVKESLEPFGFELIDDKKSQTIEQIKDTIIELVHYNDNDSKVNLSDYLVSKLHRDYSSLSKLFSEVTNTTIEKYLIAQKIERAKELLVYGELSLNEIADKLNYSSAAYLSAQFKSVTGLTPSYFKKIKENKRKPLDEI